MTSYMGELREDVAAAREARRKEREDVLRLQGKIKGTRARLADLRERRGAALASGNQEAARRLAQKIARQETRFETLTEGLPEQEQQLAAARAGLQELRESRREAVNFMQQATLLMSFMPPQAVRAYADLYAQYGGDPMLALTAFRQDDRYSRWFAGNLDPQTGMVILSEADYVDTIAGYRMALVSYGIDPRVFESRLPDLIQGHVSPGEFGERLTLFHSGLQQNISGVREWYATNYGLTDLTDESLLAALLDPQVAFDVLQRNVNAAIIGGEGLARGFNVTDPLVQRLLSVGYGQSQAANLFAQASVFLPRLAGAAGRGLAGPFGIEQYVGATALGEAGAVNLIQRLSARESSLFSEQGKVAGFETGRLAGLREE